MIFQKKRWILKDNSNIEDMDIEIDGRKIKPQIVKVLNNRGIQEKEEIEKFLNPSLKNLHNPFLLPDMKEAVKIINQAILCKSRVLIYGDYDCDGVTSTYLLYSVLKNFLPTIYYIPNRFKDGYGLNFDVLKKLEDKFDLLITVDTGISAQNEVKYLKEKGKTVIITDHHEPKEVLPEADAVINPKRKDSIYPFRDLAGVGVAFKLLHALKNSGINLKLSEYLDVVAIGTIADVMPLVDENRVLAKFGLKVLKNTKNVGLKKLIEVAGLSSKEELKPYDVSFIIGPRLNAAGRISDANLAVSLLLEQDIIKAESIAKKLDEENRKRQEIEEKTIKEAQSLINKNKGILRKKIFVLSNGSWHAGVVGIASSKITEKYYRPSLLLTLADEGVLKGSGRSIKGFNLFEALRNCAEILLKFGGHEHAAGLSLPVDNVDKLDEILNSIAQDYHFMIFKPAIEVDLVLSLNEIDDELIDQVYLLEPFGVGNPEPTFLIKNLVVENFRFMGDGNKYYKFFAGNSTKYDVVCFSNLEDEDELISMKKVDIVCKLEKNLFNSVRKNQFNIIDICENVSFGVIKDLYNNLKAVRNNCLSFQRYEVKRGSLQDIEEKRCVFVAFWPHIVLNFLKFLKGEDVESEFFEFLNKQGRIIQHQSSLKEVYFDDIFATRLDKLNAIVNEADLVVALDMPSYQYVKNFYQDINTVLIDFDNKFDEFSLHINEECVNVYKTLRDCEFISYNFSGIYESDPFLKVVKLLFIIQMFEETGLILAEVTHEGIEVKEFFKTQEKVNLKSTKVYSFYRTLKV
ncbi:single-stranded-DNA-specific exonuclease RecJ [Caldicellulosiruptor kronotskyensis 2002]|uniref:Single-stranded-DNA-specific exonuclease RecJ n=1 Tax=Caldicellulosiruptor kronotskyensis (strain DSM 18902 / VKM B-2412 / 2002) TaxID=632348 RepID=E4SGB2_CALK2|nr:single-stranded-DNA-specific exonuclease RecJ [Caldicellulosiruptor kronotskyensis]ADQ46787.1 single-stranded-DNA-specific exonuclease RecJ [Caldicellulosiruptor kronotskyensis 2002]